MNPQGKNAYLGQTLIAQCAGLSERAVVKHVALANQAGWLATHKRHREGQAWYGLEYAATIPDAAAIYQKRKPWAKDSPAERHASRAGRPSQRQAPRAGRNSERHAPNDRRHAQNGATTRTDRSNDPHQVRTILGLNSGDELRNNVQQSEALKTLSAGVGKLRADRIKKAFAKNPQGDNAQIAKDANTTVEDVERYRALPLNGEQRDRTH
jgi:hypothetical protein